MYNFIDEDMTQNDSVAQIKAMQRHIGKHI
jgi:hypothetical protein